MKLPEYETFLGGDTLADFWNTVKYFLFYGASLNMVYIAFLAVGTLIVVLVRALTKNTEAEENEDDEYEFYHYK
ncbi:MULTISPECIES: hypothetical protein [Bacillus cereus group]|jgi:large-conductance mechanosensitive channel|uniref:hypothetical protein n=1 Tax=Bacillus cereus group TaxID=86661 RepID=UPI000BF622DF|nr:MULTISPECIES: hypothetical protein [Bacillus cereus group]MDA2480661.1 hypothetical protein [Bacillus cereus]MDA2497717.1 hypothetical protein [Bacillus cereus]NIL33868.1 hypothetical protein [Bacillus thuringiensis]PFF36768.1 hypothetical protein CN328_26080 [Bacillus cereus]TFZ14786.1 hypothetical protein C6Y54_00555 [Bacillus cereus]